MKSTTMINNNLNWLREYFQKGMDASMDMIIKSGNDVSKVQIKENFRNAYFDYKKGLELIEHLQYELGHYKEQI